MADVIEWAYGPDAEIDTPTASHRADGWAASETADSKTINWMWGQQAQWVLWIEYQSSLYDTIITPPPP
jgi:hypothetical protein